MRLRLPDSLARRMYADYLGGMALDAVGKKYRRTQGVIGGIFHRRGWKVRTRSEAMTGKMRPGIVMPKRVKWAEVQAMYADYMKGGMSLKAVERKYGRADVRVIFLNRGLAVRESPHGKSAKGANGCVLPCRKHTKDEIIRLILASKKVALPEALKQEWRHWSLERRGDFAARLRAVMTLDKVFKGRPTGPFSDNVVPFEYGSPAAHAIADRMNAGVGSRGALVKLDLGSEGVIWGGRLWFWSPKVGYQCGPWKMGKGRPALHHAIYEQHHGVKLQRGEVIRMKDGNWNNLDPENLVRLSRNDILRENHAKAMKRRRGERDADGFFQMTAGAGAVARIMDNGGIDNGPNRKQTR